nr:hypothetical protein CFP56_73184 [Quercus suber]
MNGDVDQNELARLNDQEVELIYDICKRASLLDAPPFKAIFEAYATVLIEHGRSREHDSTIFRALIPVGDKARKTRPAIDPLTACKRLLLTHGLSVIDADDDGDEHSGDTLSVTRDLTDLALETHTATTVNGQARGLKLDKRRVSFDDARLEETWLLQSTGGSNVPHKGLLSQRPRRPTPSTAQRRASISSHRFTPSHQRPLHLQPDERSHSGDAVQPLGSRPPSAASDSRRDNYHTAHPSATSTTPHPVLLFNPSQTNLENDAETFAYTSEMRCTRRCLHSWHDATLFLQQKLSQASGVAAANDRRLILKDALDSWRLALISAQDRERQRIHAEDMERRAEDLFSRKVLSKRMIEWKKSCDWQSDIIATARSKLLRMRYFRRWKSITITNLSKSRSILLRKTLLVWLSQSKDQELLPKQARALRETTVLRSACRLWYRQHSDRKADSWRTKTTLKHGLDEWRAALRHFRDSQAIADERYASHVESRILNSLRQGLIETQQSSQYAGTYRRQILTSKSLSLLHAQAVLIPVTQSLNMQRQHKLQRKTLTVLHLHFTSARQAAEADRLRVMQNAWTNWNDTLRRQALTQKMAERILVGTLYRWVLEERCRLFSRSKNQHLAHEAMRSWSARLEHIQDPLNDAKQSFHASQLRRRTVLGMMHLHSKVHRREDAERAAIEFANSKLIPSTFEPWCKQTRHVHTLQKWAEDARFFTLTTNAIKVWHERSEQHKVEKRRQAYIQTRASMKVRLVRSCLNRMRERCVQLDDLQEKARSRTQRNIALVGVTEFRHWRTVANRVSDMNHSAVSIDRQRLLGSSFAALFMRMEILGELDRLAEVARREADLDVLGSALKKLQWVSFSAAQHAARRIESAEALWTRTRDTHIKRMIRVWQTQSAARIAQREQHIEQRGRDTEPESPSLRPASRAASRSAQRFDIHSPTARERHTPAYLRTPSRSRKNGRFRPVLPTPATLTDLFFQLQRR